MAKIVSPMMLPPGGFSQHVVSTLRSGTPRVSQLREIT
jgi:hypothetical protein